MASTASRIFKALKSALGKSTTTPIVESAPKEPVKETLIKASEALEIQPETAKAPEAIKPVITNLAQPTNEPKMPLGGVEIRKPLILKAVKAHVPQIKFRKGSLAPAPATHATETSYTPAPVMASVPASAPAKWNAEQVANLEWWQTPSKFKRRTVDDLEVDLINSGGADHVYQ